MEGYQLALLLFTISVVSGLCLFWAILRVVPHLERKENLSQKEEVLKEALRQKEAILADARSQAEEHVAIMREELESHLVQRQEDIATMEEDLQEQERLFQQEADRIAQIEAIQAKKDGENHQLIELSKEKKRLAEEKRKALIVSLGQALREDTDRFRENVTQNLVQERRLDCQRVFKSLQEELSTSSRKLAWRALDRVHSRYAPTFAWPKWNQVIDIKDPQLVEVLTTSPLLTQLHEISEVNVILNAGEKKEDRPPSSPFIKVAGGFGVAREAVRLTLEDLLAGNPAGWNRALETYNKHRAKLDAEVVRLGRKAVNELRLYNIHPEIQKLVGALNWRTSYRQNQWYHTVEVAVLAGILAQELGVDPDAAKRVGLLHDIGKAIDYRIDGSHAVISGDYADRYGEDRFICDTVMSHHADLLVETPLAYVLRAADTLSGARPGARVNLEEGYQTRLDAIYDVVYSFAGITDAAVMNGGREVHIQVDHRKIPQGEMTKLTKAIIEKIEEKVVYPGQIKVIVSRVYEASIVAG